MQDSFFSVEEIAGMSSGLRPPAPKDYKLPTHFPDLRRATRIGWDWETVDPNITELGNGVYRKDGHIVGGSIAAWDHGKLFHAEYYPIAHRGCENLDKAKVIKYFADNLNFFEGEIVGANLMYEGDWGQSEGIMPVHAKWRDVQWAEPLIDEMAFNYKLETLAQKYLRIGKVTNELKELYGTDYIKRFDEVHPGHARSYGLGDVLLPSLILDEQYKELESLGMTELFKLESRLTPFLLYMRRQGVRIDMDRAMRFKGVLEQKIADKVKEIRDLTGVHFTVDNFGDKRLLKHTFEKLKIELPLTANGDVSVTDKWLHELQHPIGKLLEAANKAKKAKGTFIDGYVFGYAVNGRLHGDFHPLRKADDDGENGTESGRLSGSNPNLQNIPTRDEEIGPMCRSMFVPELGAQWWAADYSQIEYRHLVHAAVANKCKGADVVQQMYIDNPDTDFHQALSDIVSKVLGRLFPRKDAKNLNFGLVYGMGLQHLAETLNMLNDEGKPNDKVKPLMESYHSASPFVKAIFDICVDDATNKGEIRTILNRRSQFDFWEPANIPKGMKRPPELPFVQAINAYGFNLKRCQTHKALNRKLQGSAADHMKLAMVMAWEAGIFTSTTDFTASLTIHDELDGSIFPTARGMECYKELKRTMETCMPLHVPVLVSADIAADWSEAK